MKKLTVISQKLSLVIAFVGLLGIVVMMFYTVIDVFARLVLGKAMTGVIEVMSLLFCATLYSGFAYTQTRHDHIHVTMFVSRIPGKGRFATWGITSLIALAISVTVTIASFIQTGIVREQGLYSQLLWIPLYPFYLFGAVCMGIYSLCLLLDTIKSFLSLSNKELADEISAIWPS